MFGPRCIIMDAARNQISDLIVDHSTQHVSLECQHLGSDQYLKLCRAWMQPLQENNLRLKILANQLYATFIIHDCRYVGP